MDGSQGTHAAACREQTAEIALGPKGPFEDGIVATLTLHVPVGRVFNALPPRARNRKPPKAPRTPRVVELLRKAIQWQALLESGQVPNQA